MVHFTQCHSAGLFYSAVAVTGSLRPGYPIRKSAGHRICAPYRSLSQLITSFFVFQLLRHPPWTLINLAVSSFPPFMAFVRILLHQQFYLLYSSFFPFPFPVKESLHVSMKKHFVLVGRDRVELSTPALSERCSNQLSYHPNQTAQYERKDFLHACAAHGTLRVLFSGFLFPKKEVIQPHLPVRLPCYDFTPLTSHTLESGLLAVSLPASGIPGSDGVTGGVYKARERIHRAVLMRDY